MISACAPTLTSSGEAKDAFYEERNVFVKDVPQSDKLILLGDFSARVGTDSNNWKGILGPHGTGKLNSNGLTLLSFCAENDLTITNTLFPQADKYKTTWMHPRSKQLHLIDYAICRRRDIRDIRITIAMQGTECWTNHSLIRSVLSLHITPARRKTAKSRRPASDTAKLKQLERSRMFAKYLDDRLTAHGPLSGLSPQEWEQFKILVTESTRRKPSSSGRMTSPPLQSVTTSNTSKFRQRWHLQSARRVVGEEGRRNRNLRCHKELKNVLQRYSPTRPHTMPLLSADGSTLLKEKSSIIARWRKHFSTLLYRPSTVDPLCSTRSHRSP